MQNLAGPGCREIAGLRPAPSVPDFGEGGRPSAGPLARSSTKNSDLHVEMYNGDLPYTLALLGPEVARLIYVFIYFTPKPFRCLPLGH